MPLHVIMKTIVYMLVDNRILKASHDPGQAKARS